MWSDGKYPARRRSIVRSRGRRGTIANNVERAGVAVGPARVMHRGKGGRAVTGRGFKGDTVEGMDVRRVVGELLGAGVGRSWGGDRGATGSRGAGRLDVVGVLQLDAEVVLPAAIHGGRRNAVGQKFRGEVYTSSIEREHLVVGKNAVHRDDSDEKTTEDWKAWRCVLLIVAEQAEHGEKQQAKKVAIVHFKRDTPLTDEKRVDDGKRYQQNSQLVPCWSDGDERRDGLGCRLPKRGEQAK
jgi:hypothetical protein